MKDLTSYFVGCLILISLLTTFSSAQEATENLLEKVSLNFSFVAEPTAESVGFNNPKSYWNLEYELVLTDSSTLEKIGRCYRNEEYKFICPLQTNKKLAKKLSKKIRQISIPIAKSKFKKKELLSEANRDVVIPIQLSSEVIDIFNKAVNSDNNPTFVLFVKTKAFTRTSDKVKFKKKLSSNRVYPLKFYRSDKTFDNFWNIKNLGYSFGVRREGNIIKEFVIIGY
jgi:hypothetical protein